MKRLLLLLLVHCSLQTFSQIDSISSGRAIRFDGIDDYIDLGNLYDDFGYPFTVSAWVYFDDNDTGGPVLVSQDNAPLYNGFWFFVSPNRFSIEYGDGFGENLPAYRRGKYAEFSSSKKQWNHYCAVVRGIDDISLYLNGVNMIGDPSGQSLNPIASNYPNDVAKIGFFLSNGITYRFKGVIDEVRVFKSALDIQTIREDMCQQIPKSKSGLVSRWTFDETSGNSVLDQSANASIGQLMGNPERIYSGAPIGDVSTQLYTSNWNNISLTNDDLTVKNVTGLPKGIHIYKVNSHPSRLNGLNASEIKNSYSGVFICNNNNTLYSFDLNQTCEPFKRTDNASIPWTFLSNPIGLSDRIEVIQRLQEDTDVDLNFDLGPQVMLCDQTSYTISPAIETEGKKFQWNTGATTPSLIVTQSGTYELSVYKDCQQATSSIVINFNQSPPVFNFGEDKSMCVKPSIILNPSLQLSDLEYLWQDGSNDSRFEVSDYGEYWLEISNACGVSKDTITFQPKGILLDEIPNVITPNDDNLNQFFKIPSQNTSVNLEIFNRWGMPVYYTSPYKNDWDGKDLPSGVYYYYLYEECAGTKKGSISILK